MDDLSTAPPLISIAEDRETTYRNTLSEICGGKYTGEIGYPLNPMMLGFSESFAYSVEGASDAWVKSYISCPIDMTLPVSPYDQGRKALVVLATLTPGTEIYTL